MRSERSATDVFLLAHPDDEFACSIGIARSVERGREVVVVYTTDGGYGGQSRARREAESLVVLTELGVRPQVVHFVGSDVSIPDGRLVEHLDRARDALSRLLPPVIETLYLPAWEGGHQDHDATHLVGLSLADRASDVRQFPLYRALGREGPLFQALAPLSENGPVAVEEAPLGERAAAFARCFAYPSQWRSFLGLAPFALVRLTRHGFVHQPVDPARVSAAPHVGAPLYERRGVMTFAAFAATASAFIRDNIAPVRGSR